MPYARTAEATRNQHRTTTRLRKHDVYFPRRRSRFDTCIMHNANINNDR